MYAVGFFDSSVCDIRTRATNLGTHPNTGAALTIRYAPNAGLGEPPARSQDVNGCKFNP